MSVVMNPVIGSGSELESPRLELELAYVHRAWSIMKEIWSRHAAGMIRHASDAHRPA